MEAFYYALGDHDVITIVDLPNAVSVTAIALQASATGLVRTKTTALLSIEETDEALQKSIDYRGPGQ